MEALLPPGRIREHEYVTVSTHCAGSSVRGRRAERTVRCHAVRAGYGAWAPIGRTNGKDSIRRSHIKRKAILRAERVAIRDLGTAVVSWRIGGDVLRLCSTSATSPIEADRLQHCRIAILARLPEKQDSISQCTARRRGHSSWHMRSD